MHRRVCQRTGLPAVIAATGRRHSHRSARCKARQDLRPHVLLNDEAVCKVWAASYCCAPAAQRALLLPTCIVSKCTHTVLLPFAASCAQKADTTSVAAPMCA